MRWYSRKFERDYKFYYDNRYNFNFCGTLNPKFVALPDSEANNAKEVFYQLESNGNKTSTVLCSEAKLLNELLLCKGGINFQIKQWAEGRVDGTLSLYEFSKDYANIKYNLSDEEKIYYEDIKTLEWVNKEPVYHRDIQTQFGLPTWVIEAVEKQKDKLLKLK
jgi:hypothetical protein